MRTYVHDWNDHKTAYVNDDKGFCKVNIYDEKTRIVGELYDLVVYPEWRGKGFGGELLSVAIAAARQEHCDVLVLWPDAEEWVRNWYMENGFVPDGEFRNYDNEIGWCKEL